MKKRILKIHAKSGEKKIVEKSTLSRKQDEGDVFAVRECAQSIPRLEKPKNRRFSHKNPKMFDFRFNTPTPFPESGSRKHLHASGMRGIDFSHKITPRKVIFAKIQKNFFSKVLLQFLP